MQTCNIWRGTAFCILFRLFTAYFSSYCMHCIFQILRLWTVYFRSYVYALSISDHTFMHCIFQVDITKDMKCADTRKARNGDKVTVHYGGFLQDGMYTV